jgi:hypothetical protein
MAVKTSKSEKSSVSQREEYRTEMAKWRHGDVAKKNRKRRSEGGEMWRWRHS